MGFYEQISKYYDLIFPVGQTQLGFIRKAAGQPPKKLLDVACGSGEYAMELAREGYRLTAADLDDEMIRLAKEKASKEALDIDFLKCDMRELANQLNAGFDCIYCIGNSIVHLPDEEQISGVLSQMCQLLNRDGTLILQIINYDRIIKFHINELPPIRNEEEGLEFIRRYEHVEEKGKINFATTLTVSKADRMEKFDNVVELLPLKSKKMVELLMKAGFNEVELFGDFAFSPYSEDSYMLVVKAFTTAAVQCR